PEYDPKLERMSRRTTPLSVSTFGPFEPSPGNGPAVSSGIALVAFVAFDAPAVVVDELEEPDVVDVVVDAAFVSESPPPLPPAATLAIPAPARRRSARRRASGAGR